MSVNSSQEAMDSGVLALRLAETVGLPVKVEIAGMWAPVVAVREANGDCVILTLAKDWDPKMPEKANA